MICGHEARKQRGEAVLYLLDTYAWIEYLIGSDKGKTVKKIIDESSNECLTLESSLAELKGWSLKDDFDFTVVLGAVRNNSHLESIEFEDWIIAAEIKAKMRKTLPDFGLMNALLLAKQKKHGGKIVTGDPHFEKLPNAVFLK